MRYTSRLSKNVLTITIHKDHVHEEMGLVFCKKEASEKDAADFYIEDIWEDSLFSGSMLTPGLKLYSVNQVEIKNRLESVEELHQMLAKLEGSFTFATVSPDGSKLHPWILGQRKRIQNAAPKQSKKPIQDNIDNNNIPEQVPQLPVATPPPLPMNSQKQTPIVVEDLPAGPKPTTTALSMEDHMQQVLESEHQKSLDRSNIHHDYEERAADDLQQDDDQHDNEIEEWNENGPLEVLVLNKSRSNVKLYWDDGADGVLVASLGAKDGEHRVTTYKGHSFFCCWENAKNNAEPHGFTISPTDQEIVIPEMVGVEFAVIFVNKSQQEAKLYWDDGSDGVLVGTLSPTGGEHRINTYKNHSFFAKFDDFESSAEPYRFHVSYEDEIIHIPEAEGKAFKIGFQNDSKHRADLLWDDGVDGVVIATLEANGGQHYATTYKGHSFLVRKHGSNLGLVNPKTNLSYDFQASYLDQIFVIPGDAVVKRKPGPGPVVVSNEPTLIDEAEDMADRKPTEEDMMQQQQQESKNNEEEIKLVEEDMTSNDETADPTEKDATKQPQESKDNEEETERIEEDLDMVAREPTDDDMIRQSQESKDDEEEIERMEEDMTRLETESNNRIHSDIKSRRSLLAEAKEEMQSQRHLIPVPGDEDSKDRPKLGSPSLSRRSIKKSASKKKRSSTGQKAPAAAPIVTEDSRDQVTTQSEVGSEKAVEGIAPVPVKKSVSNKKSQQKQKPGAKGKRRGPAAFASAFGALTKPRSKVGARESEDKLEDSNAAPESKHGLSMDVLNPFQNGGETYDYFEDIPGVDEMTSDDDSSIEPELELVWDKVITDAMGFTGKYTGTILIESGLPHGVGGIDYWVDDECVTGTYDGDWEHGCWDGYGESTLKCGDTYTGEFQLHERHGEGEYVWETEECNDGSRIERYYTGNFESNQRHGFGVFTWKTLVGEKENLSVYKGMYHHGKRQGQGVYTNMFLKYSGQWFQDFYHGMGRLEVFNEHIHRGNFRMGQFVEKASVPPPFVLASHATKRDIAKRHNVLTELTKKAEQRPKIEALPNKYEAKETVSSSTAPQRNPMVSANMLAGVQLMKRAPVGDMELVAVSLPPDSVRNPKKQNLLAELGAVLTKRDENMKPENRPIEIVSLPRKVKGSRGRSTMLKSTALSSTNKPWEQPKLAAPARQQPLQPSKSANHATRVTSTPTTDTKKNMLAQLSKPPALKQTPITNSGAAKPTADPRRNLMSQLAQPPALKSAQQAPITEHKTNNAPPKRKMTMLEELQAKMAAKT
ncbi:unnamed protein product [Cylindrotheca closterium]|uniref:Uncharacterized protein n=1 Tax=Cylindrotheca closterium TaxID=2856 RepID=A0AAD2CNH4_9STRA|nr:unnamed protein product [Cylindrotheca closterium]